MPTDSSENQDLKIIKINSKLYDQVRSHCDLIGIRFIDFVEDSLENAFSLNEIEKVHKETKRLSESVKKEYKKIYLHGFKQGFSAAFYLKQGQTGISQECTPEEVREESDTFIPGDGKQIKLFD
jgi:hypothetical protein